VDNLKGSLAAVFAGATLGILWAGSAAGAPAAEPAKMNPVATATAAATATAPKPAEAPKPATPTVVTPPAEGDQTPAAAKPAIQISGRLIHTWYEKPGVRVILAIDGFTVQTRQGVLTARDGVVWFDETEAQKSGRVALGVYAETGVEFKHTGGQTDRYDSVYLVLETAGEMSRRAEEPERGKADGTELYLRAKKMRQEYLTQGVREQPTAIVPPPPATERPVAPGVREANVPQEIRIEAQDDVRKVTFSSVVEGDRRVSTWSGGVYITFHGQDKMGQPVDMEMATDNLVLWVPTEAIKNMSGVVGEKPAATSTTAATAAPAVVPDDHGTVLAQPRSTGTDGASAQPAATSTAGPPPPAAVTAKGPAVEAYMEGHVRINRGQQSVQASQIFYDFGRDQALIINAKIHTVSKVRNLSVYFYAKEARQVAKGVFVGTDASLTLCEFAEPHSDVHASKMTLQELTPEPEFEGEKVQYQRLRYLGEDMEARLSGVPLTWWPRMAGDVTEETTALRSVRIANQSRRGLGVMTQWHLLKLLGIAEPTPGFDLYLDVDAWAKRGPALGVEGKYDRPNYYGEFLTYVFPNDPGTDKFRGVKIDPPDPTRGRATWRHRTFLPENWQLTLEASYVSDASFMNEFFQKEDQTGKALETLAYLKKQEHEQAFWLLASARVNDFYTRTEYFPQVGYDVIGHSFWDDKLTYYQDSEVALARYAPHDPTKPFDNGGTSQQGMLPANADQESPTTFIFDSIHEVDLPLKAGNFNIVPFTQGRVSYFSNTVDGGGKMRFEAQEGARLSTQAWKVYNDVESEFWDLHRLRDVNTFDVTAYASQVSLHSRDLYPFGPTEDGTQEVVGVDGQGVLQLGWRKRLQTKRGLPDANGKQQNVDWLTTDLEATFYANRTDPNIGPDTGPEFNNIDFRVHWRTTDTTSLWSETLYNLDDSSLEKFTIGALFTQSPRVSYTIGQRIIPDGNSSITFIGMNYVFNEKWDISFLEEYDWDRGKISHSGITFTRRLHRWLMRLKFSQDPGGQGTFAGIEFQPIGIHEIKLGG
jgi:hypothetical protein